MWVLFIHSFISDSKVHSKKYIYYIATGKLLSTELQLYNLRHSTKSVIICVDIDGTTVVDYKLWRMVKKTHF